MAPELEKNNLGGGELSPEINPEFQGGVTIEKNPEITPNLPGRDNLEVDVETPDLTDNSAKHQDEINQARRNKINQALAERSFPNLSLVEFIDKFVYTNEVAGSANKYYAITDYLEKIKQSSN